MRVVIVTFDSYNELDSFVVLPRSTGGHRSGSKAKIVSPSNHATSMNGVTVQAQQPLLFANPG